MARTSRYCKRCARDIMCERPDTNHVLHLLLSVFTAGLWLPIWVLCSIKIGGWRCLQCGRWV